jgi:hypothetical protein
VDDLIFSWLCHDGIRYEGSPALGIRGG